MGFASTVTVLPLFVRTLTSSAVLIGLVPAMHSAGWQLPQLFTAGWVARQKRYRPMVLLLTINERLPFLGLALAAALTGLVDRRFILFLVFALLAWQGLGGGLTANAWQSMIAKIIPPRRRGAFYGAQAAIAHLLVSLGAVLAGFILGNVMHPWAFSLCFGLASLAMMLSWLALAFTSEPEHQPRPQASGSRFWGEMRAMLRQDVNFRWFLSARMLSQLAMMGLAFYSVYAVEQHNISAIEIGWMTGVMSIVQFVANPILGWLGDRWSHRRVMEIGLLAAAGSGLLVWLAGTSLYPKIFFYLAFILAGIANVSLWTTGLTLTLLFGDEHQRPAYIGMSNTLIAPANMLAPLVGGWLADASGYPATFLASVFFSLIALSVFHWGMRDPKISEIVT